MPEPTKTLSVYIEITHGRISKPHTAASAVLGVHAEVCDNGAPDEGDDDVSD